MTTLPKSTARARNNAIQKLSDARETLHAGLWGAPIVQTDATAGLTHTQAQLRERDRRINGYLEAYANFLGVTLNELCDRLRVSATEDQLALIEGAFRQFAEQLRSGEPPNGV